MTAPEANALLPCPTPWCESKKVMTATYYKSRKDEQTGEMVPYTDYDHSCPACHVRTPQLPRAEALTAWNTRAAVTVKSLRRYKVANKLGWTLDPQLLMEVGAEIEAEGWDTCLEVTEIAMLSAERRILSALSGGDA